MLAGAVDVEIEHRHGRLEGAGLAAGAGFGRAFEGAGDGRGVFLRENALLEVERVALFRDFTGPILFGHLFRLPWGEVYHRRKGTSSPQISLVLSLS